MKVDYLGWARVTERKRDFIAIYTTAIMERKRGKLKRSFSKFDRTISELEEGLGELVIGAIMVGSLCAGLAATYGPEVVKKGMEEVRRRVGLE